MTWKERWSEMSWYRRILLMLMAVMILGFSVAMPIMRSIKGIGYGGSFFRLEEEGEVRRYAGREDWEEAVFTVCPGGVVEYQWGEYTYGPYQVVEDPTASPQGDWAGMPGVEIRRGGEVLFRGGYENSGPFFALISQDGEWLPDLHIEAYAAGGVEVGEDGHVITQEEKHEPDLAILARLVLEPELTCRGSLEAYLLTTLLALFNVAYICSPDFFFYLSLVGHVRDPERAEPSDSYVVMEHLGWALLTVVCLALYCNGLFSII